MQKGSLDTLYELFIKGIQDAGHQDEITLIIQNKITNTLFYANISIKQNN